MNFPLNREKSPFGLARLALESDSLRLRYAVR